MVGWFSKTRTTPSRIVPKAATSLHRCRKNSGALEILVIHFVIIKLASAKLITAAMRPTILAAIQLIVFHYPCVCYHHEKLIILPHSGTLSENLTQRSGSLPMPTRASADAPSSSNEDSWGTCHCAAANQWCDQPHYQKPRCARVIWLLKK